MTMPTVVTSLPPVTMTARCPQCGHDATWHGRAALDKYGAPHGTTWHLIECPACDGTQQQEAA